METFVKKFIQNNIDCFDDIVDIVNNRKNECGAYIFLENKTKEDIREFEKKDIVDIIKYLYSTQRKSVENDLLKILDYDYGLGLKFYKFLINHIKSSSKLLEIDRFHYNLKSEYRELRKFKFGKGTISQIAHFCEPSKYILYNDKSKQAISNLFKVDVDNNMLEFVKYANKIVECIEENISNTLDYIDYEYLQHNKYVLLDEFFYYAIENNFKVSRF